MITPRFLQAMVQEGETQVGYSLISLNLRDRSKGQG